MKRKETEQRKKEKKPNRDRKKRKKRKEKEKEKKKNRDRKKEKEKKKKETSTYMQTMIIVEKQPNKGMCPAQDKTAKTLSMTLNKNINEKNESINVSGLTSKFV